MSKIQSRIHRREIHSLCLMTSAAVDAYEKAVRAELDLIRQRIKPVSKWAERGGELPEAVRKFAEISEIAFTGICSCDENTECEVCKASDVVAANGTHLSGLDYPVHSVMRLAAGFDRSLTMDAAVDNLQQAILDATNNTFATDEIMNAARGCLSETEG